MLNVKICSGILVERIKIPSGNRTIPALVLSRGKSASGAPGVLWIHGGGYFLGMKEMVFISRAMDLVKKFGAVVVSPGYRLAFQSPYPAAIDDCYNALLYMKNNSVGLGIRSDQLMIGGESAGGGLCAALCMMARDKNSVNIAYQMPLYPMMDNFDTASSVNNHGRIWNTTLNHIGWKKYLGKSVNRDVSPYAAAARQKDYSSLPPAYTFVGDGEPFYTETLDFVQNLKNAGVPASSDVYHCNIHGFDMLKPNSEAAKKAAESFNQHFCYALEHYFAPQMENA